MELLIKKKLREIFKNRANIDFDNMENLFDQNLFSKEIGLLPSELVYIFFDVEEEFHITIDQKDTIEEKFSTFNGILEIIYSNTKMQGKAIEKVAVD